MKDNAVFILGLSTLLIPLSALAEIFLPLKDIAVFPERSAPATVFSLNDSVLSSQISARVASIDARVSQQVNKGESLLRLECDDYELHQQAAEAALESAVANESLAQAQLQRSDSLFEKSLISQQLYDARKTESLSSSAAVKQATVALRQAELNVSRCNIKAPFSGVVTQRMASLGQLADVGTQLIAIVDHQQLEVSAKVSYYDAARFNAVNEFWFVADTKVPLRLHNLGNVVDPNTRSREVRFEFIDEDLLPGTAGRLQWQDPRPFIPAKYIVTRGSQRGVFVNVENIAEFVPLPSADPGRDAETTLPLETLVVIDNLPQIQAGQAL